MPGVSKLQSMGHMQPVPHFVNKVLLQHSHAHSLWIIYDCFRATAAKPSRFDQDLLHCKAWPSIERSGWPRPLAWPLLLPSLGCLVEGRVEEEAGPKSVPFPFPVPRDLSGVFLPLQQES